MRCPRCHKRMVTKYTKDGKQEVCKYCNYPEEDKRTHFIVVPPWS